MMCRYAHLAPSQKLLFGRRKPHTVVPTILLGLSKIEFMCSPEIVRLIGEMQLAEKRGWVAAELR
jgi:hypothetical protein